MSYEGKMRNDFKCLPMNKLKMHCWYHYFNHNGTIKEFAQVKKL